jgi:hypothetical protein
MQGQITNSLCMEDWQLLMKISEMLSSISICLSVSPFIILISLNYTSIHLFQFICGCALKTYYQF